MIVGRITMTHPIEAEWVDDILTAAFEGGINYWCGAVTVKDDQWHGTAWASDVVSRGGTLLLDHEDGVAELDLGKFLVGFEQRCIDTGQTPEALFENHDALDADCIVQLAVFGELVYG